MAHEQERGAILGAGFANQLQRLAGIGVIEIARGLVGEHELGAIGQCTGDGHALLLAAGKLARTMMQPRAQPDAIEQFNCAPAIRAQPEGHSEQYILQAGKRREQVERLENVANRRCAPSVPRCLAHGRDLDTLDHYPAAIRLENARDEMQERRLSQAALAPQRHLRPGLEREVFHVDHLLRTVRSGK